tara:strand:+ start:283 stop:864 length:582 start_codon:yes stop_codon:yes gene_type:complete
MSSDRTVTIDGVEIPLEDLFTSTDVADTLGVPSDATGATFTTLDPKILAAMNPNDPQYQRMITGTTQQFLPSLMRAALGLGSGKFGGLGRSGRSFGTRQSEMFQPYLGRMSSVYDTIGSSVGQAEMQADNWLAQQLQAYRELDYQEPTGLTTTEGSGTTSSPVKASTPVTGGYTQGDFGSFLSNLFGDLFSWG